MKKSALHIFWLLLLLLFAAQANAATYYVSKTGNNSNDCSTTDSDKTNKQTIAAGIGCLSAGDTLEIHTGTYAEMLSWFQGVQAPSGTSYATATTIRAYGSEVVTIQYTGSIDFIVFGDNQQYITLDNLHIDGNSTAGCAAGVKITYGSNPALSANNITIQNSEIKNCLGQGILSSGAGNRFIDNNIHHNGLTGQEDYWENHGIYAGGADLVVTGNLVHDNSDGIQIQYDGTTNAIVANNKIYDNMDGGIVLSGITGSGVTGASVYNNVIYRNGQSGGTGSGHGIALLYGGDSNKIYNNTLYLNGSYGSIQLGDNTNAQIKNNILSNGSNAPFVTTGTFTGTFSNNLCQSAATNCALSEVASNTFVNAAGGNFQLQSTSAAKEAGTPLGSSYATDYDGNRRPFGDAWDIGAYEYGSGPTPPPTPPTPALVLALPFDAGDGNTAVDLSGFNNNGLFGTGVNWDNSGKYGKALSFDGTGGITIQPSSSLDLITGFTLEAWVNVASTSAVFRPIMIRMRPDGSDMQYSFYLSGENYVCNSGWAFSQANNSGSQYYNNAACDTSSFPTNQWVHLAATYGGVGTTLSLYRDGQIVSSITPPGTPVTSSGSLYIGLSAYSEYFVGKLDEVRIYNYRRTQAEIQTDMATPLTPTGPTAVIKISPATSLKLSATNGALKVGQ